MNHAIAAPSKLLPGELDRALRRRFGRPLVPLPIVPFGLGLAHSFGQALPQLSEDTRAMLRKDFPAMSEQELTALIEMVLLAGPPEDLPVAGIAQPPLQFAEAFAADENAQAELFAERGAEKGLRRRAVRRPHDRHQGRAECSAGAGANVTNEEIVALGVDGVTELLLDLPSRAAGHRMMWWQHDNPQTEWKPNDLNDIAYLSVAVGYCDVVVTERKWTHILNASGAAKCAGTVVTSRLDDLTELLVDASLAA